MTRLTLLGPVLLGITIATGVAVAAFGVGYTGQPSLASYGGGPPAPTATPAHGVDTDGDGCPDLAEPALGLDPANPWDFFSVPIPALMAASNPTIVFKDNVVSAGDAQSVFAYFKAGAKAGQPAYDQDLNNNGIPDGLEYDRSVAGAGQTGPPRGVISATAAQLAFAQFRRGYRC